ncbi:hypothetical protein EW146_g1962 [Bondarzewia mesenterica]|uniref:BRCT domain-containing protein n=1 Tax=Bondarzewia mesenterica TaxID=1095465 RepID=A0A4S4M237_9AGAM|nr:hypothetical protein EW146_g1962 [Bondarzewia mesenterica]
MILIPQSGAADDLTDPGTAASFQTSKLQTSECSRNEPADATDNPFLEQRGQVPGTNCIKYDAKFLSDVTKRNAPVQEDGDNESIIVASKKRRLSDPEQFDPNSQVIASRKGDSASESKPFQTSLEETTREIPPCLAGRYHTTSSSSRADAPLDVNKILGPTAAEDITDPPLSFPSKKGDQSQTPKAGKTSNIASPGHTPAIAIPTRAKPVRAATMTTLGAPKVPKMVKHGSTSKITLDAAKKNKLTTKPKSKVKEKPVRMTPTEYARMLRERALNPPHPDPEPLISEAKPTTESNSRSLKKTYLKDFRIFYTGGDRNMASDITKGRMNYIYEHGGILVPEFDPEEVTHIITSASEGTTLRALGLKKLKDIPEMIPTLKWSWVISYREERDPMTKKVFIQMQWEVFHAAFEERRKAGLDMGMVMDREKLKQKLREKKKDNDENTSHTSAFTVDHSTELSPPPTNTKGAGKLPPDVSSTEKGKQKETADPLAEFYEQAQAEKDAEVDRHQFWSGRNIHGSSQSLEQQDKVTDIQENDSDLEDISLASDRINPETGLKLKGFVCDDPSKSRASTCPNQDVIDKLPVNQLEELMELHRAKPSSEDGWRVYSYSKVDINRYWHAKRTRQIMEIIQTGELRRIRYEKTDDVEVVKVLMGIYGVGQKTAYMWYSAGCRTLDDVRQRRCGIKLSAAQEIGLRFYDDINTRMPREEAQEIFVSVKEISLRLDPKLSVDIMGSYRRGKATCGDIDILITPSKDDGKTHAGILPALLLELHAAGVLTEDLTVPDESDEVEAVYRGLCVRPGESTEKLRRRIDILVMPWENRGAALIYYTGDDIVRYLFAPNCHLITDQSFHLSIHRPDIQFNRSLRLKANKMGYSLNQRGLYRGVNAPLLPRVYDDFVCDFSDYCFRCMLLFSSAPLFFVLFFLSLLLGPVSRCFARAPAFGPFCLPFRGRTAGAHSSHQSGGCASCVRKALNPIPTITKFM